MSDTSGLQNADAEGVPAEDRPERFQAGGDGDQGGGPESGGAHSGGADASGADASGADAGRDAQEAEPPETAPGQGGDSQDVSAPHETGVSPEGAEDVTTAATTGDGTAEPPPADFDPAQQPSNPDLVGNTEPPD